jgi:chromate transporter
MILFGGFYTELSHLRASGAFLAGLQASALGVIFASVKGLSWTYRKRRDFWVIAPIAMGLTWLAPSLEPLYIIGAGAALAFIATRPRGTGHVGLAIVGMSPTLAPATGALSLVSEPSLWRLAWTCFKSGAFVFGSGLAIVPLMESDFVRDLQWLTHQEFMNALAFGQITPGPVSITATFIGFKTLGIWGAIIGTIAINLAPFLHMMTWFPRAVNRLSQISWIPEFSAGSVAAAVGAIIATGLKLTANLDSPAVTLPVVALSLLIALRAWLPIWGLIPLGGVIVALISQNY